MKVVFTTLNAKYVHINLAIRTIAKHCSEFSPIIKEYTINDNIDSIIASLHMQKADVIAFSCYIWNIEKVLYICRCLKEVNPQLKIILGGHEVSYDGVEIMQDNPWVDYIISGEGEKAVKALLDAIKNSAPMENVPSLTYKKDGKILCTPLCKPSDINEYTFPYDENIRDFKGKIIYYESSRGCPFSCAYCLSGNNSRVSYLQIERVKKELLFFIENDVPLVKFVDRTFNADKNRAKEIFAFLIDNAKETLFHFEMAGSLIDDETIEILKTAPKGLFQFEIGVQSTNEKTIKDIGRKIDFEKLRGTVKKLINLKNVHIHLDLIAGLPYEGYESFKKSFDDVISLCPDVLQLGFLKLLKGSRIRGEAEKFGYKFKASAPYEVMENDFISFDELIKLKFIEDLLDKYYNSGDFKRSMELLFKNASSPFEVFEKIYAYYEKNALFEKSISLEMRYEVLSEIFDYDAFKDTVKADRLTNRKAKMSYENEPRFKENCFEFLKNEGNIKKYLPEFLGEAPRKIYKNLRFEELFGGVYMYVVKSGELIEITKDFREL